MLGEKTIISYLGRLDFQVEDSLWYSNSKIKRMDQEEINKLNKKYWVSKQPKSGQTSSCSPDHGVGRSCSHMPPYACKPNYNIVLLSSMHQNIERIWLKKKIQEPFLILPSPSLFMPFFYIVTDLGEEVQ